MFRELTRAENRIAEVPEATGMASNNGACGNRVLPKAVQEKRPFKKVTKRKWLAVIENSILIADYLSPAAATHRRSEMPEIPAIRGAGPRSP
jgi:hypothetical protein